MSARYVLIDYENVQPETLERLDPHCDAVRVFVGAHQSKLPTSLVTDVQRFNCDYIRIAGSGRNVLDFHIAYYLGQLAAAAPAASFYIVSKDAGFDPLIGHLKSNKIEAQRVETIDEIARINDASDQVATIADNLRRRHKARPRTVGKLQTVIHELFQRRLKDEDVRNLIGRLTEKGFIILDGVKVSYKL